ncbi:hypothetical protein [Helicobacter sp. 11S03491-1]|uniref:hypothetical protein n=1 Tax=Helicobacter sp. 11S03491-1 TaxID=1476196 RepID=UPI000BA74B7F|nr:hypothetical protein [Helicobacter sp. 11S03491-1]PAF43859.1 hypothetical protein BKH45_00935 [Helicobacter sp. 11S03491-1]
MTFKGNKDNKIITKFDINGASGYCSEDLAARRNQTNLPSNEIKTAQANHTSNKLSQRDQTRLNQSQAGQSSCDMLTPPPPQYAQKPYIHVSNDPQRLQESQSHTSNPYSQAKPSKKAFAPLVSLVLSSLLLSFSAEALHAADTNTAINEFLYSPNNISCSIDSGVPCAIISYTAPGSTTLAKYTNFNDMFQLYIKDYTSAAKHATLTVKDSVIVVDDSDTIAGAYLPRKESNYAGVDFVNKGILSFSSGAYMNATFKNSALKGNLASYVSQNGKGGDKNHVVIPHTITFEGNYEGNSDVAVKGYALLGNLYLGANTSNIVFDSAKMKGNIYNMGTWYDVNEKSPINDANIVFQNNSTLRGNIGVGQYAERSYLNITFDNSTWNGSINTSWGNYNFVFKNHSTMTGEYVNTTNATWNWKVEDSTLNLTRAEVGNWANFELNLKNSTLNLKNASNQPISVKVGGTGDFKLNLDNSKAYGLKGLNLNGSKLFTITLANNSILTLDAFSDVAAADNSIGLTSLRGKSAITSDTTKILKYQQGKFILDVDANSNISNLDTIYMGGNRSRITINLKGHHWDNKLILSDHNGITYNYNLDEGASFNTGFQDNESGEIASNETLNLSAKNKSTFKHNVINNQGTIQGSFDDSYMENQFVLKAGTTNVSFANNSQARDDFNITGGNNTISFASGSRMKKDMAVSGGTTNVKFDGSGTGNDATSKLKSTKGGTLNVSATNGAYLQGQVRSEGGITILTLDNATADGVGYTGDSGGQDSYTMYLKNGAKLGSFGFDGSKATVVVDGAYVKNFVNGTFPGAKGTNFSLSGKNLDMVSDSKYGEGSIDASNPNDFSTDPSKAKNDITLSDSKLNHLYLSRSTANVSLTNTSFRNFYNTHKTSVFSITNTKAGLDMGDLNLWGKLNLKTTLSNIGAIHNHDANSTLDLGLTVGKSIGKIDGVTYREDGSKNKAGASVVTDTAFSGKSLSATFDFRDATKISAYRVPSSSNAAGDYVGVQTSALKTDALATQNLSKFDGFLHATSDQAASILTFNDDKSTSPVYGKIDNIVTTAGVKNNLTFIFGGKDTSKSDGSVLNKQNVTITGGNNQSGYTFVHAGTLDASNSSSLVTLAKNTGITFSSVKGTIGIEATSIVLKNGNALDKATLASLTGMPNTTDFIGSKLVFGNARLISDPNGQLVLVANNPTNPSDIASFATLTQKGKTHNSSDKSFVSSKSSDGDIGTGSDGFRQDVSFLFTPGTFDIAKRQQGFTGNIKGGTKDSSYTFYNAGVLNTSQLSDTLSGQSHLTLVNTALFGIIGESVKSTSGSSATLTPVDVNLSLDYSGNSHQSKGLAIVGQGKHTISFDFTGNTQAIKFEGALLGGNSKSVLSFINLKGLDTQSTSSTTLLQAFKNAGIRGINNKDYYSIRRDSTDFSLSSVDNADKSPIDTSATFELFGTSLKGDIAQKDYGLTLHFDTTPSGGTSSAGVPYESASYSGKNLDLSGNTHPIVLDFIGADSINPRSSQALTIKAPSSRINLNLQDTGATIALQNAANIWDNSSLNVSGSNFIGDFVKGNITANFDKSHKFYGTLGGNKTKDLSITLGEDSLYANTDLTMKALYSGVLKVSTGSSNVYGSSLLDFSNSAKKHLVLENPGQTLVLKGLKAPSTSSATDGSYLDNTSVLTITDNKTSLIGDLYGTWESFSNSGGNTFNKSTLQVNLNFDTSKANKENGGNYYQGNLIGELATGSSLKFTGPHAIRSTSYSVDTNGIITDSGKISIALGGSDSIDLTLNNTQANVTFTQDGNKTGWNVMGNFDIRGTNIVLDNGLNSADVISVKMAFANARVDSKNNLLKTKDGSLLTSDKTFNGVAKEIDDYIANSSLSINQAVVMRGGDNVFSYFGDASLIPSSPTATLKLNNDAKATYNMINMGKALETKIGTGDNAKSAADLIFGGSSGGISDPDQLPSYTYNLRGTSLKDAHFNAGAITYQVNSTDTISKKVAINLNAIFDNRDVSNKSEDEKYYHDSTMGNAQLEIAKSALEGKLVLDDGVHAAIDFIGEGAFAKNAQITGGADDSNFTFRDTTLYFGVSSALSNLDTKGNITLDKASAQGVFNPTKNTTFSVVGLKNSSGGAVEKNNILVFKDYSDTQISRTSLKDIGGYDYSGVAQGSHFIGSLAATNTSYIFTFIGENASGFGKSATESEDTDSLTPVAPQNTKFESDVSNYTLNFIDSGVLKTSNLETLSSGSNNAIALYGKSALSLNTNTTTGKKELSLKAPLTISATINQDNLDLWEGDSDSKTLDFNITSPVGSQTLYNITFDGGISYPNPNIQFFQGSIGTLNKDSSFSFKNAGFLQDSQINKTQALVTLEKTLVKGNISIDNLVLDFSPVASISGAEQGLDALSGNIILANEDTHIKDITFNFSGNSKASKIKNASASDKKYYLAGSSGSGFSFVNLANSMTHTDTPSALDYITWTHEGSNVASNKGNDSVFKTLSAAGIELRPAGTEEKAYVEGKEVSQSLDANTTFGFYGSTIHASSALNNTLDPINSTYNLKMSFDTTGSVKQKDIPLSSSSLEASKFETQGDLSLSFVGKGSLNPESSAPLTVKIAADKSFSLRASNPNKDGLIGEVKIDTAGNTSFKGGNLNIDNLSLSGTYLTAKSIPASAAVTGSDGSVTTPATLGSADGNISAKFDDTARLGDKSILGSKDGDVSISIANLTPSTNTSSNAPIIVIGDGKTNLSFKNAGIIKINSTKSKIGSGSFMISEGSAPVGGVFTQGSTLSLQNTSLIGSLFGDVTKNESTSSSTLKLNLSFDTTTLNPTYYQGDNISVLKSGSILSFKGKDSIKALAGGENKVITFDIGSTDTHYVLNNTGASIAFHQNGWNTAGVFDIRGTNVVLKDNLDSVSNIRVHMVYANANSAKTNQLLKTKDGSLLTDTKYTSFGMDDGSDSVPGISMMADKDIADYILPSTLSFVSGGANLRGGSNDFTFIGDKSVDMQGFFAPLTLNYNAKATINLINMDSFLTNQLRDIMTAKLTAMTKGSTTIPDSSTITTMLNAAISSLPESSKITTVADLLFMSSDGGGDGSVNFVYNLAGTSLGDAYIRSPKTKTSTTASTYNQSKVTLDATFDQRELSAREEADKYYTNSNAIGNAQLEIAKSKLSGKLELDSFVSGHLKFLGTTAFDSGASLSGGTADSWAFFDGAVFGDYSKIKDFKGSIRLINASLNSDLKNTTVTTPAVQVKSAAPSFGIRAVFNQAYDDNTTLSSQALKYIQENIDASLTQRGYSFDKSESHVFSSGIGYTASALKLDFIGKDSVDSTNFKIESSADNIDNVYTFIDFGKIDLKAISSNGDGKINGSIYWIGNSYQTGLITNGVDAFIDLTQTNNDLKDNIYRATEGIQNITFDFGGNSSLSTGVIQDGKSTNAKGYTPRSNYTFSHVSSNSIVSNKNSDFTDTLNHILVSDSITDSSKSPIALTTGQITLANTSVKGDIKQGITKDTSGTVSKDIALGLIFNTSDHKVYNVQDKTIQEAANNIFSSLSGSLSGDAKKEALFIGVGAFDSQNKDSNITEGTEDSSYRFVDSGLLDDDKLDNILNGGHSARGVGVKTNKGTFSFDGQGSLHADIVDQVSNMENIKNQVIHIAQDTTLSPYGMQFVGSIATQAKEFKARFGLGSVVNITNRSGNAVYDFSAYANTSMPVVASIDLDSYTQDTPAAVKGFDGNVSLIGALHDINTATNTYTFKGGSHSPKGSQWAIQNSSEVNKVTIINDSLDSKDSLLPSIGNHLAIIDLRGDRDVHNKHALEDVKNYASPNPIAPQNLTQSATLLGAQNTGDNGVEGSFVPHKLTIGSLNAKNALFRVGVSPSSGQGDVLQVAAISSNKDATNYLQAYLYGEAKDITSPILVASIGDKVDSKYLSGLVSKLGIYLYTPTLTTKVTQVDSGNTGTSESYNTSFYLSHLQASINAEISDPVINGIGSVYRDFRVETNNLHLRMGELRGIKATQGVWARVVNGMGSDASDNRDFYTTLQAGYDYKFDVLGGVNYVGVSADASLLSSKGDAYNSSGRNLALGIYNTYIMDNGFYVDAIAKYMNLYNNLSLSGNSQQIYNNAFLLGGEVGYRYSLDNLFTRMRIAPNAYTRGYFVEPQLELIYGYIGGSDFSFKAEEGIMAQANLEGNNAFITRVGGVIGKRFESNTGFKADVRLGLAYLNEINTGGDVILKDTSNLEAYKKSTPMNNALKLSLGTNMIINDDWRVYGDISRTFLGTYNIDYNLNIGVRWNFGTKGAKKTKPKATPQQYAPQPSQPQAKPMSQEEVALFKNKQTVIFKGGKTQCQGCQPESGYYFQIVVLSKPNAALTKELQKFSYRAYSFKNFSGQVLTRYLVGPFKSTQELLQIKPFADKLAQEANNNKQAYAVVYEIKDK